MKMHPRPSDFWTQIIMGILFPWFLATVLAIDLATDEGTSFGDVLLIYAVTVGWTLSFGAFLILRLRRWQRALLPPQRSRVDEKVWTGFWSTLLRWLRIALFYILYILVLLFVGAALGGRGT